MEVIMSILQPVASQQPGKIADGAETQNVVPTTADDKQNAPRESGEELIIPKACKEGSKTIFLWYQ